MGRYNDKTPPKRTHSVDINTMKAACGIAATWLKHSFLVDGSTDLVDCKACRKKLKLFPKVWHAGRWHDNKKKCPTCGGRGSIRTPGSHIVCETCKHSGLVEATQ